MLKHQGLPHPNVLIRSWDGLLIRSSQALSILSGQCVIIQKHLTEPRSPRLAGTVSQEGKLGAEWTYQRPVLEHTEATSCNSSNRSGPQPLDPQLPHRYSPPLLKWVRSKVNDTLLDHRTLPCKWRDCQATQGLRTTPTSTCHSAVTLAGRQMMLGLQITLPSRFLLDSRNTVNSPS